MIDQMFRWILCGAYSIGIIVLSLTPSKAFNKVLREVGIPHSDKVVHFAMYGVLAILVLWALRVRRWGHFLILRVILGCFLYGALMEVLQLVVVVGDRHFSWEDMTANGLGAGAFVYLYVRLNKATKQVLVSDLN